jgi:hypothetical protein
MGTEGMLIVGEKALIHLPFTMKEPLRDRKKRPTGMRKRVLIRIVFV